MEEREVTILHDLSYSEYDALPGIRSSVLKRFRDVPASVLLPEKTTDDMLIGAAIDSWVLCGEKDFHERFVIEPDPEGLSRNSKEWKKKIEEWRRIFDTQIILPAEYKGIPLPDLLNGCRDSINAHPYAKAILEGAQTQLTVTWDDEDTNEPCKARIDINPGLKMVVDLKMTSNIDRFRYVARDLSYPVQLGFYAAGMLANELPVDAGVFVIVEPTEPYRCAVWTMPGIDECSQFDTDLSLDFGLKESRRLVKLYSECRDMNWFPRFRLPESLENMADLKSKDCVETWGKRREMS